MTDDPTKLESIRSRLRGLLRDKGVTVNRLADGDAALQRRLSRQLNEEVNLTVDTILYFLNAFPGLSASWVLEGQGNPFPSEDELSIDCGSVRRLQGRFTDRIDPENSIPVYSVEASANLDTLQAGEGYEEHIIGTVHVPNVPRCDGATYVRGDSMYPLLQSGDLIGFRQLPVSRESIFFGEIYLISLDVDGDRYLTVKYIQPSMTGDQYVTLE
ncbi:MAG: hypothetical protein NC336_05005, partial [Clostridium sp.]|nr:hypothetical protein [Clostridium sp.]